MTLFGAASASGALDEIRGQFKRETGTDVKASYAAASALAQQIAYGAEADVFVSASTQWADHLDQKALVKRRRDLLGNRLVIIVPADSQLDVQKPEDLVDKAVRRLALADYTAVPAGIYAREALTKLGLWEQLRGKVVSGADVRQALAWVESGAAEAGLVYATDACEQAAPGRSLPSRCRLPGGSSECPTDGRASLPMFVQFSPTDVTLSRHDVAGLSARSHLQGRVCQVVPLRRAVFVAVDIGQVLWAEVTPEAAAELELKPGSQVICLLKAHSLRVVD